MNPLQFIVGGLLTFCALLTSARCSAPAEVLDFAIKEGNTDNYFYRQGEVAAHVVVTSGTKPRILFAFPAGNTGAGLWFAETEGEVALVKTGSVAPLEEGPLHGVQITIEASTEKLVLQSSLLTNMRGIRDYIYEGLKTHAAELAPQARLTERLVLRHLSVDRTHQVVVEMLPLGGTKVSAAGEDFAFHNPQGKVSFQIAALTDESPLTPFRRSEIFNEKVAHDQRSQDVFAFLSSQEKLLAGSWRFNTYFGRDTLNSIMLLRPVLQPRVVEAALGSVLERLGPEGQVAHEEGIGEFAALLNLKKREKAGTDTALVKPPEPAPASLETPDLDYKMIDGEFLLPPALAAYLLDSPDATAGVGAFLGRRSSGGDTYRALILRNFRYVVQQAEPFARSPAYQNLISLKPGLSIGNWRDSDTGLGGGRYPYDVNAVLVPAALNAISRTLDSGLLGDEKALSRTAKNYAEVWRRAASLFVVVVPEVIVRREVTDYAASLKIDAADAVEAVHGPMTFHAISLDAAGKPVPIMNTDEGAALFFSDPSPEVLEMAAHQFLSPFPAGLRTEVGLVVANPVFAPENLKRQFTVNDYHGTVIWSWQQALIAAGLERQLARGDLPAATREKLLAAQTAIWQTILRLRDQSAGELWSWKSVHGRIAWSPYGQTAEHADESNAAQLWSTVYLAVQPPKP